MKTIAFDVMGNDNGVQPGVEAAVNFINENRTYKMILVGNESEISKYLPENTKNIKVVNNANIFDAKNGALSARKDSSSMTEAINLVKNKEADIVMSSGDSGGYISSSTLNLKRIKGVKRPAFLTAIPSTIKDKKIVFLDLGANIDVTSEMLEQWAILGHEFSKNVLNVSNPKVNLVNIGTEEYKGIEPIKEANLNLLKNNNLNYKGFIEPRYLLNGSTDVAVIDGYGGNLIIKTIEGTSKSIIEIIKNNFKSKFIYKIGALLSRGAFVSAKEHLNYKNVGMAWLIGLNGLAVKCHGSSDFEAFTGALKQIKNALDSDAMKKMKEAINA